MEDVDDSESEFEEEERPGARKRPRSQGRAEQSIKGGRQGCGRGQARGGRATGGRSRGGRTRGGQARGGRGRSGRAAGSQGRGRGRGRLAEEPNTAEVQANHEQQLVVCIFELCSELYNNPLGIRVSIKTGN